MHIKLTVDAEIMSLWEAVFNLKQTAQKICSQMLIVSEWISNVNFFQEVTL